MRADLLLRNLYHRALPGLAFTYGIPLPQGLVREVGHIALLDAAGKSAPLCARSTSTYADGSVRWALLDFLGNFAPGEQARWQIVLGEDVATAQPAQPVRVTQDAGGIHIDNGVLQASFGPGRFRLFQSLGAGGVEIISPRERCDLVLTSPTGKIYRASYDPQPKLSLEEHNPIRAVVRWDGGLFAGDGARLTHFRVKLTFTAGNPYVKIEHAMICREDPPRGIHLRSYVIRLESNSPGPTTKVVRQVNHGADYFSRMVQLQQNLRLRVPTTGQADTGPAGYDPGILGGVGKVLLEDESAFQEDLAALPHFLQPDAPRVKLGGGYAQVYPYLGLRWDKATLVASILRMGPQHPKAITCDEGRIDLELYPHDAPGLFRLAKGMTKTHHLALSFFGRALSDDEIDNEAVRRENFSEIPPGDPVTITVDPAYLRLTRQVEAHALIPSLPQRYPKLETKLHSIKLHSDPLGFHGIIDYGEGVQTNNEEDGGHTYAMEYFRSGDYQFFLKMAGQMLHNSTVDVVDYDPDPLRQGGTPYHTNYHQDAVCVTSHTWTEGMFEYAYLTGDREAYRAAVGICDWILRYMKGKPQIVQQDGREIGWPIIALVAGYQATWDQRYLDGAYELVSYYRQRIARYGELLNSEPPGTGYRLAGYGEYAGFEGMHKLWQATGDEELRKFALLCMEQGYRGMGLSAFTGHGRFMDMYLLYALYDMTKDPQWLDECRTALPVVLARPSWDGYTYRRIVQFLGLCHEHNLIDDNLVALPR